MVLFKKNTYTTLRAISLGIVIGLTIFGAILLVGKQRIDNGISKLDLGKVVANQVASPNQSKYTDFGIEILKIKLRAPITANVNGDNKTEYNNALKNGLAHYKGTELPGEGGNIFVFGHSSSDTDDGQYSKFFAKLNDLTNGDKITVTYKSKEYVYTVSEKKVVAADDLSPLNLTDSEQLTLMTCWPIGTKDKRLIVIAK